MKKIFILVVSAISIMLSACGNVDKASGSKVTVSTETNNVQSTVTEQSKETEKVLSSDAVPLEGPEENCMPSSIMYNGELYWCREKKLSNEQKEQICDENYICNIESVVTNDKLPEKEYEINFPFDNSSDPYSAKIYKVDETLCIAVQRSDYETPVFDYYLMEELVDIR